MAQERCTHGCFFSQKRCQQMAVPGYYYCMDCRNSRCREYEPEPFHYLLWHIPTGKLIHRDTTNFETEQQFGLALANWNRQAGLWGKPIWRYEVA